MKKELISEILKFKVLSEYETKNTYEENVNSILESRKVILQNIEPELGLFLKKTGGLGPGGMYKTVDDVMLALKNKTISDVNLGTLYKEILLNSKNSSLKDAVAQQIVKNQKFAKGFSSGTAAERLLKLKTKNPNLSDDAIKRLHKFNEKRIKDSIKSSKKTEKAAKASRAAEAERAAEELAKAEARGYNRGLDDFYKNNKPALDDYARRYGHPDIPSWVRSDRDGFFRNVRDQGRTGKGIFGKIINWGGRIIGLKTLWSLAKIAGVSWGVWWLFFSKEGFKVTCDNGKVVTDPKYCETDKKPDQDTDDDKIKVGGGGGDTIVDTEGNKYQECEAPYYLGCVNKTGNTDIKKVQDCLGVTPNGFFNKETEDALYNKINKKSFSPSDIRTICTKPYGGLF
jgi:hypothetical protein